ncbi:fbxl14, putative [Pediculus humanus corporis]|uniref:Fbxl14, putative n=1 Tax=Pediculus humanus subsp. corporis TaxID=121224 RepID=E0VAH8_PEDHC|nr:fbxl14, putative [Pediculus humanus corporis]EEB10384.1 fbxl14, putative [Pediculus humanus corporis]
MFKCNAVKRSQRHNHELTKLHSVLSNVKVMDESQIYTEIPLSLVTRRLHRPQFDIESDYHPTAIYQESQTHVSCLYPEILALIFSYLDVRDKGRAAQVCVAWRDAAYHKSVWRGVEAKLHLRRANPSLFSSLVRRGIRRVQVLSLKRSLRDVVQGIPNLDSLNLSGCYNVTDIGLSHAFVTTLPTLTELNLSLCKQVTDTSLGRIAQYLTNLEVLELGGCCNVTNTGLLLVGWGLKKLKRLNLRSCWHISDQGISHLAGPNPDVGDGNPALEYLGLQDCQRLSDEALRHVSVGLTGLKSINLSFCVSITDSGLKYLAKMTSLRELNLRACDNISDLGMAYLAEGGSRISSLDVSFCDKIGDQALLHVSQGLFHLKSLSLNACNISDDGIVRIAITLHDLETLNIGQCWKITDRGVHTIVDSLKHLRCIDLYGCSKITTVGLERIMKLPQLTTLNLGLWHVR